MDAIGLLRKKYGIYCVIDRRIRTWDLPTTGPYQSGYRHDSKSHALTLIASTFSALQC